MIKEFVQAWDKYKGNLEEYIRTHEQSEYDSYDILVRLLFVKVINPWMTDNYEEEFAISDGDIYVIDDGDYQGTRIFILHKDTYQPWASDYVYTNTYYGSCSGCDTLLAISGYDDGLPNEGQVKDYMTLCLHLLQRCNYMNSGDNECPDCQIEW